MQSELRALFYDKVEAYGQSKNLSVSFPNMSFTPPDNSDFYFKVASLPVEPDVHGVNGGHSVYLWILQLSIYARDGVGEIASTDYADELRESVFPIYSKWQGAKHEYQIMTPPNARNPIPMDGWHATPVRFQIQTID